MNQKLGRVLRQLREKLLALKAKIRAEWKSVTIIGPTLLRPHLPPKGTLPWDRWLAPACVAVTGIITATLLLMAWNEKRTVKKNA